MAGSEFLDALRQIVGVEQVLADPDVRRGYERDWTGRFGAPALAVVRPGDTREVAATVASCAAHRVAGGGRASDRAGAARSRSIWSRQTSVSRGPETQSPKTGRHEAMNSNKATLKLFTPELTNAGRVAFSANGATSNQPGANAPGYRP